MAEQVLISVEGDAPAGVQDFFSAEWCGQVQDRLLPQNRERNVANDAPPLHAPKLLRSGNPSAYVPHFISFGPYHYRSHKLDVEYSLGQKDALIKISTKEAYKVQFVAELCALRIGEIFAMIKSMWNDIAKFYRWAILEDDSSENFALMMMVDSIFLIIFFLSRHDHGQHAIGIKCDILKLENQIPLFLLKQVHERLINLAGCERVRQIFLDGTTDARQLLERVNEKLSPFYNAQGERHLLVPDKALDEPHLLGCMHAIVSPFLKIEGDSRKSPSTANPSEGENPIKFYTAGELSKAGIKFEPLLTLPNNIRFDKPSRTLYLPTMTLSNAQTEVFFRNMLALEFVEPQRLDNVTRFIQLTFCLIHTAEDVRVLRNSLISKECMLTDEHIAGIWDSIRKPFSYGHVNPPLELKVAFDEVLKNKFYWIKVRISISELYQYYYNQYFSKPWNIVALLVGLVILAMNVVVAYCSVRGCESDLSIRKIQKRLYKY